MRYLLFQIRDADDPMRPQEVVCFARALDCDPQSITVLDLLTTQPTGRQLNEADIVLIGGSGNYSVVENGEWIDRALESMRLLHDRAQPTFASCWGFQAMARALGGKVVTDFNRAEVGTHALRLTAAGLDDPVMCQTPPTFLGQMGHQDIVEELPEGAILLASTERVKNQAFRFANLPIYCTQFHPELRRSDLLQRVREYPQYIEKTVGMTLEEFSAACQETPDANRLLKAFVDWVRREHIL